MILCRSLTAFVFAVSLIDIAFTANATETPSVSVPVAPIDSVLVAVPEDGRFNGKTYFGSGHFVAYRIAREFEQLARKVDIAPLDVRDRDTLFEIARRANDTYLVIPTIIRWEHRVRGTPSRAGIDIVIVQVSTGQIIQSTLIEADSSTTIVRETNPDIVAIGLIHDYVGHLYGR